ncbi:MAG TPA: hypothetical protein PKN38_06930 [Taishania sp.]|nr:hypothetical protein [Taishania sp.]
MFSKKYRHIVHRAVVALSLVAFLLANVGMLVYTHSCTISGTEKTLFAASEDPCEEDIHLVKEPCCSEENTTNSQHSTKIDEGCCTNNADYVALNIDLHTDFHPLHFALIPFDANAFPTPVWENVASDATFSYGEHYIKSPPDIYQGRDLQSIHQVYII